MPIYEFKCKKCDEEFDFLFMVSDVATNCPKCGEHHTRDDRIEMSVNTFHLNFRDLPV